LKGNAIKITETTFGQLERLCQEFCFSELSGKLSEFSSSMDFKEAIDAKDAEDAEDTEDSDELQRSKQRQINTIT
jgi:hypothetical protein